MKRFPLLLVVLLALAVGACSSEGTDATPTPEPTPTATPSPEPTPEPTAAAGSGFPLPSGVIGADCGLLEVLPEELNGAARIDVNLADNPMFAQMLAGSGVDPSAVEYVISTYGTGDEAVSATAICIPGIERPALEQLARLMTGAAEGQGSAEVVTMGGKEVIVMSSDEVDAEAYMYFVGDGVVIVGGPSPDRAAELLSQLP